MRLLMDSEERVDNVGSHGDINEVTSSVLLQRHVEEGKSEEGHSNYFPVDGKGNILLLSSRLLRRVAHCLAFLFLHYTYT